MDKAADVLAQLRDIHLPKPISWWPLAPAWYLVFALILLSLFSIIYFLYQKMRKAKTKKEALRLLKTYKEAYKKDPNSQTASAKISELLKQVALVYFPRQSVAGLHGEAWLEFLMKNSHGIDFLKIKTMLLDAPFNLKTAQALDLEALFAAAERWIKQRRKRCLN